MEFAESLRNGIDFYTFPSNGGQISTLKIAISVNPFNNPLTRIFPLPELYTEIIFGAEDGLKTLIRSNNHQEGVVNTLIVKKYIHYYIEKIFENFI